MLKIEVRGSEERILEYDFQQADYPLIHLLFKPDELKTKVIFWKKESGQQERLRSNKYIMDIKISESSFQKIISDEMIRPGTEFFSQYYTERLPPSIRNIVADILHCPCDPKFKLLYLRTKVSELFIQILSGEPAEISELNWTEKERTTFNHLKAVIDQDLKKNYSIEDLAQLAGMNRTKMQAGFKGLFGKTIYAYTLDSKMLEAKAWLSREPKGSLKEIAALLGYKHTSHFSAAFKKKFTFPPSFFKKGINLVWTLFLAFT